MPRGYRAALLLLALIVVGGGATGALSSALVLEGWPRLRGAVGGLCAVALGVWLAVLVLTERWPRWLAALLGDDDAV